MNQVFLNLLMNAVQSCADTGGAITLRSRPENSWVVIEVEDNGSGIKPDHLPRIFDPFFTTKPVGQGTGLGLSVSYGIVRDHGGSISVKSEPDIGSTFCVRVPSGKVNDDKRSL
jgi:two-component system NtrC family sensor kinase